MGFEPTIFAVTERYANRYTTRPIISGFIVARRLVEPHLISNDVKFFCCLPTSKPLSLSIMEPTEGVEPQPSVYKTAALPIVLSWHLH